jgi:transposase
VVREAQDQGLYQRRFAKHLPTMLAQRAPYRADRKGVVGASPSNWSWLVEGLREADDRGPLAPPAAMQQESGLT